jgi:hypothetical protein
MKRIVFFVCILAMSAVPAMVSAQGLPSLGGLGSLFGSAGPCGEAKPGLIAPPTLYVGWSGQGQGANFGIGLDTPVANLNGVSHTYDLSALALGISGSFTLSDRISVIASGWWMVPSAGARSIEPYDLAAGGPQHRSWSTDTNWWWVDALAAYNLGGGVAFLGGFRFDRFETRFKNPQGTLITSLGTDEANVESNGYIPLLGLLYSTGSSANMITAYAVGFPTLLGRAEYHQTVIGALRVDAAGDYNNGFFFEARLDYKRRIMGDADLGAFFRYNATRGTFSGSASVNTFGSSAFRGGLNRNAFSLGGSVSLPFRLPFM